MEFEFLFQGQPVKITVEKREGGWAFSGPGLSIEGDMKVISANILSFLFDNRSILVYHAEDKGKIYVSVEGQFFLLQEPSQAHVRRAEEETLEGKLIVSAPMPGKVIKVCVAEGEKVRKNQTLAIVEAMKMENEIKSALDGEVIKVHIADGDLVDPDKPMIELEAGS